MVSLRENTFESNSSSCHSLVIVQKDLLDKLERGEVIYVGGFRYYDDYEVYVNELESKFFIEADAVKKALVNWLSSNPDLSDDADRDFFDLLTEKLNEEPGIGAADLLEYLYYEAYNCDTVCTKILLQAKILPEGVDSDDACYNLKYLLDPNGDNTLEYSKLVDNGKTEIRLMQIYC